MTRWAILTGEYPPQPGGVADYTRLVARGLAAAGDRVYVFAPPCAAHEVGDDGVAVVRLPDHFGRRGRAVVTAELLATNPDVVLVQYVPHAFGRKAMNLPFVWWVTKAVRRFAPVWVMFHEVAYPFVRRPLKHNLIAVINRLMARRLATAAERVFVTIPTWGELLRKIAPRGRAAEWLPVPPTLPTPVSAEDVAAVRRSLPDGPIVGHFGTYGDLIMQLLEPSLAAVLRGATDRAGILIGRNGVSFLERILAKHPDLTGRVVATGELPPEAAAAHLAACDVLLQPYPDGVSCRRTSAMCGFALGVPVVTNLGALSEPFWSELSGGLALATGPEVGELVARTEEALANAPGRQVPHWFTERFGLDRTITALRTSIAPSGGS